MEELIILIFLIIIAIIIFRPKKINQSNLSKNSTHRNINHYDRLKYDSDDNDGWSGHSSDYDDGD